MLGIGSYRVNFRRTTDGYSGTVPGRYVLRCMAVWKCRRLQRRKPFTPDGPKRLARTTYWVSSA